MNLDRRTLLIGGGAGIGLIVAYALWPGGLASDLATAPGEQAFGAFIKIGRDGKVIVAVPQVETGQGIWTALPQLVADELGAAWELVGVEPAPVAAAYANPLAEDQGWLAGFGTLSRFQVADRMQLTAGSTSVRAFEAPMRLAAATARAMLVGAAADRWNIGEEECDAADGFVIAGARTMSFGELAEEAASRSPPRNPPLRDPAKSRLIGRPLQRLDGPAKTTGKLRFAADVRLPSMLFASARLAPPGGGLASFDRDALRGRPGVRHVTARDEWIAVVADTWWAAEQALKSASPRFTGQRSAADMRANFDSALAEGTPREWLSRGDYDGATAKSRTLAATYYAAPSQHLGLEPLSATARPNDGSIELWAPTLAPGLAASGNNLYPLPVGEPSGAAMESSVAPIAIELARLTGRPVQVTLPQSASQNHDRCSPGALARLTALPGAAGITAAWAMRVVTADGLGGALARLAGNSPGEGLGATALAGAEPPYSIPNMRIEAIRADLPFAAGYMRGSPQRELTFFNESFIDELARAASIEPLAFRMSMLGQNGRLARCLQGAARLARWDGGAPGSTMGIAGCSAFGSHIGLVATASIGPDQRVAVERLVAAVDCGRVINSGLVEQQIEAGLIWALAQATVPAPEWVVGMPRARALGGIGLPRIGDTPEILVQIIPSSASPGGVSGLGATVLAPAVANAIFAGTGKRMRSLPFDPMPAA